jgi:hypothetical protein
MSASVSAAAYPGPDISRGKVWKGESYETVYAPPAVVFLHDLHSQMPTAFLLTASLPQNVHVYLCRKYQLLLFEESALP